MSRVRFTYGVWVGLRCACSSALAGGAGGDFTEDDLKAVEDANDWLTQIGVDRGYFHELIDVSKRRASPLPPEEKP